MIGLLGKKVGMTQVYDKEGRSIPVTVLRVGPCHVTQVRTKEKDGYVGVQLGFDAAKPKNTSKAKTGHLKKSGVAPVRFIREIRTVETENLAAGAELRVDNFSEGDFVDIEGVTIGKGFQGVVKRHHFAGGPGAHGSKMGREPGSIGSNTSPARVLKGLKMSGHMGAEVQTTQNLKVVQVDVANHLLLVNGAVPGAANGYLVIRNSLKRGKAKKWIVAGGAKKVSEESSSPKEASN